MQFMPATWRRYGLGGDVQDAHDAILGAANYLHASGAPDDLRTALHHYNPSSAYVDAVLRYARRIGADRTMFYALYSWQVFVKTPRGDRRVTGPVFREKQMRAVTAALIAVSVTPPRVGPKKRRHT
jgi:hypothetical protein